MSNFDGVVFLSRVRLSFPNLAVARAPQGSDKMKYSADFILAPNDPNYAKFVELATRAAQAKWPQHHAAILQAIYGDRKRRCFGNGAEKTDSTTYQVLNGYEGAVYISASRNQDKGMPQMIGADNQAIDATNVLACQNEARRMYGGCYVNAVVKPWIYDNAFGKGIGGDLIAVQFCADGAPFGEGITDASAMFAGAQVAAPAWGAPAAPGTPAPGWPVPGAPAMPAAPFPGVQAPPMAAPMFTMPGAAPAFPAAPKSPWG